MAFDLHGQAALVFGGGDALGRAVSIALAEAGADVAVASVTHRGDEQFEVAATADAVREAGRKSVALACDITRSADVDETVATAAMEIGGLNLLVNNPDVPFAKPSTETSDREWEQVLAVNLTGVFLTCRAAAAQMLDRAGPSRIVNVISLLGERGMANAAAYCAAKAGVVSLTKSLSAEWARKGITVSGLGVGFLEGSAWAANDGDRNALERYMPMRRLGTAEEVAPAIVYLASREADFMTGQIVWLEGGALSHI